MEAKRRKARELVRKMISGSTDGEEEAAEEAMAEIRALSKEDEEMRHLLVEAGAVPLLSQHLLIFSDEFRSRSLVSLEDAAAGLLNISLSVKSPLMATPGLVDSLSAVIRSRSSPAAAQNAAAVVCSLLAEESFRPVIGAKDELISALIAMLRPIHPPYPNPSRSVKDAMKAIFGIAVCAANRSGLIRLGAVPALFWLIVNDARAGIVEDATAVVAQIAGCKGSLEAFRQVSGVQVLVDLVDGAATTRARENAVAALLNLAVAGGDRAVEEINCLEEVVVVVKEMAESGPSIRAKTKAVALLQLLVEMEDWRRS
ncbi:ARM repeat superfamily protein [Wolffia australiana]